MIPWIQAKYGWRAYTAICLLAATLLAGNSAAQRDRLAGHETSPALQQALANAAAKYKIPGMAAALIEHGQVRAVEVFGMRDEKSGARVTPDTLFPAGSLGEPVYAYAVLLLSAQGKFNAGAPLPKDFPLPYVRDLDPIGSSTATEPLYDPLLNHVTAFRVMNHTSGLPDWSPNQHLRLMFPPGEKWSYSNEGYIYLQHVVEHVTGESFEEFTRRSILGPARMVHSSFVWQDNYADAAATGYDRAGVPVEVKRYGRPAAATTLYTSIQDYPRFITYLLASAPAMRAHESAVSMMLNPSVTVEAANSISWGEGLGLEKSKDDIFFFQRENTAGFQSFVLASRKTGSGIVIFTNSGNGLDAVSDIVAATLGGDHPVLKSALLHSE